MAGVLHHHEVPSCILSRATGPSTWSATPPTGTASTSNGRPAAPPHQHRPRCVPRPDIIRAVGRQGAGRLPLRRHGSNTRTPSGATTAPRSPAVSASGSRSAGPGPSSPRRPRVDGASEGWLRPAMIGRAGQGSISRGSRRSLEDEPVSVRIVEGHEPPPRRADRMSPSIGTRLAPQGLDMAFEVLGLEHRALGRAGSHGVEPGDEGDGRRTSPRAHLDPALIGSHGHISSSSSNPSTSHKGPDGPGRTGRGPRRWTLPMAFRATVSDETPEDQSGGEYEPLGSWTPRWTWPGRPVWPRAGPGIGVGPRGACWSEWPSPSPTPHAATGVPASWPAPGAGAWPWSVSRRRGGRGPRQRRRPARPPPRCGRRSSWWPGSSWWGWSPTRTDCSPPPVTAWPRPPPTGWPCSPGPPSWSPWSPPCSTWTPRWSSSPRCWSTRPAAGARARPPCSSAACCCPTPAACSCPGPTSPT